MGEEHMMRLSAADERNLNLMATLSLVLAFMLTAFGFFPSIHLTVGILMMTGVIKDESSAREEPGAAELEGVDAPPAVAPAQGDDRDPPARPLRRGSPPDLKVIGLIFVSIASAMMLSCWTLAVLNFLAARRLKQRRSLSFCRFAAGASCIFMPFGTALGVYSIVVLSKPQVAAAFEGVSP